MQELRSADVVPQSVEVLPQPVTSTYDEAQEIKAFALQHGLRSILIVTSAYHSRRALWVFTRVFRDTGIQVGLVIARREESPSPVKWWLTLRGWQFVPTEYVKMVYYLINY